MNYTKDKIEAAVKAKGYVWFEGAKDFDVNIVGVRNSDTGNAVTNAFDDRITVSYKENGNWVYKEWIITTDPGKKGVMEYHNAAGVANTEDTFSHSCGVTPIGYIIVSQDKAGSLFPGHDRVAWTASNIYLKCSVASVTFKLFLLKWGENGKHR